MWRLWHLVAHLERLGDHRLEVQPAQSGVCPILQGRPERIAHPAQAGEHLGRERAVAQHLAHAFVERGVGEIAPVRVAHHEHRHRGGDQPGHGPTAPLVVARLEAHAAARC